MTIKKETLDSVTTKDKRKAVILPFITLLLTRTILSTVTTTPSHFRYGLMGQISVLESQTYTWALENDCMLV